MFSVHISKLIYRVEKAEVPFAVVVVKIEGGECGGAVTEGYQSVGLRVAGDGLWHDAESAVCELIDAPQLLVSAGESGNCLDLGL